MKGHLLQDLPGGSGPCSVFLLEVFGMGETVGLQEVGAEDVRGCSDTPLPSACSEVSLIGVEPIDRV